MNKLVLALATVSFASVAGAQTFFASSDAMGYSGSAVRYATLADAQNGTNPLGNVTYQSRDASVFVTQNAATFSVTNPTANIFLTAWFYTTEANTNGFPKDDPLGDRYYSGWGNPNNTSDSFVQLYDDNGNTDSVSTGMWTSALYDTFQLNVVGGNANYANDFTRMWDGAAGSGVTLVSYALNLTASGLNGVYNPVSGLYESNVRPTTVSGSYTGIFQNAGGDFYTFNLALNGNTTWAELQGDAALNGDFAPSQFGAAPVPEPTSMAALGLGALALLRRKRAAKR